MNMHHNSAIIGIVTAGLLSFQASAATISYLMDQSNGLDDGQNYLKVTLTDSLTMTGALDVTVETLAMLNASAGTNFGIQAFSFNAQPSLLVSASTEGFDIATQIMSLTNLPDGWTVATDKNMSEFGKFDIRLSGTGNTRMDPLTFTLGGVTHDTVDANFAAHVAGFDIDGESSAFFAGGTIDNGVDPGGISSVPIPAAAWLLTSGFLGMMGVARRRAAIAS